MKSELGYLCGERVTVLVQDAHNKRVRMPGTVRGYHRPNVTVRLDVGGTRTAHRRSVRRASE